MQYSANQAEDRINSLDFFTGLMGNPSLEQIWEWEGSLAVCLKVEVTRRSGHLPPEASAALGSPSPYLPQPVLPAKGLHCSREGRASFTQEMLTGQLSQVIYSSDILACFLSSPLRREATNNMGGEDWFESQRT